MKIMAKKCPCGSTDTITYSDAGGSTKKLYKCNWCGRFFKTSTDPMLPGGWS